MKTRSLLFIAVSLLAAVLVVAGCGGAKTATSSTKPAITSSTTSISSTKPVTSSTTPATSSITPAGGTLPTTAPAITAHTLEVLTAYKGLCLICHGAGTPNQSPMAPSWNGQTYGSTTNTGTYTVAARSPADHTGRTIDQCTQADCHAAPIS